MKRLAFAFVVVGVIVSSLSAEQSGSPVRFDTQVGNARVTTVIQGTADQTDAVNGVMTYRGNVVLTEATGNIQIRADQITWDEKTKEYVLQGNVRLSVK